MAFATFGRTVSRTNRRVCQDITAFKVAPTALVKPPSSACARLKLSTKIGMLLEIAMKNCDTEFAKVGISRSTCWVEMFRPFKAFP